LLWCEKNCQSFESLIENDNDSELYKESKIFFDTYRENSIKKIKNLKIPMGGGGHYFLLYYLTRKLKPHVVVETGVALGFSSSALLEAIRVNKYGQLYSSDYPYITIDNPELYIGYLVDDYLRKDWKLFIKGDTKNLTDICDIVDSVDLFHYDSDKSYLGRYFGIKKIRNKLHKNSVLIMDDIQDNLFFKHYVDRNKRHYVVLKFENKYVGIIYYGLLHRT